MGIAPNDLDGGQSKVNCGRRQVAGFQLQFVTQDDGLVEGQSGLGTIPRDEIVDCEPVGALRMGQAQSIQDGYLGVVQIGKAKDSFLSLSSLSLCSKPFTATRATAGP